MSTQALDLDFSVPEPTSKPQYAGFFGFLRAFAAAVGEGAQAHDDYRALTRNGVPHDVAVQKVLTQSYKRT